MQNSDDKCFQYSVTAVLNRENIGKHPERITRIRPFIDQCEWNDMNLPTWKPKGRTILSMFFVH